MTVETEKSLTITRTVAASPEAVFEAWTRPERMKKWKCPDPNADVRVVVDLRVGGAYEVTMGIEGGPFTAHGTYREIDPPRRLVYTWDWREDAHRMGVETLVTVEFEAVEGGTEIRLTHEGFPTDEARTGHLEGWTACAERLATLAG